MVLRRIFEPGSNSSGFYVDIGAHHPLRFSNTYFFYRHGWRGLNIDAMPGSMSEFDRRRPRDINLEIPVSKTAREMTYYRFNDPALNGFDRELSLARDRESSIFHIVDEIPMTTRKLSEVLQEHLPPNTEIDFMNVDVEGLDLEVLESNDWNRFKPKIVLVEILETRLEQITENEIFRYLKSMGFEFYAKTVNTVFFRRMDFKN